jgi:hypothetical protein
MDLSIAADRGQMSSGRVVAGALIAMTIAAVFIGPLASTVTGNTGDVQFDEEIAAQHGEYVEIGGVYDITGNYTVESTGGTTYSEGSDYEINRTDGSVKALSSGTISDGETLVVTGEYTAAGTTTTTVATLVPLFAGLLILGTAAMKMRQMM